MDNETKKNVHTEETVNATVLTQEIRELVRENLVGLTEKRGENAFSFRLVGGRTFLIEVSETK